MNTKCCEVCGTQLNIDKKNVYVAEVRNILIGNSENWNAVDCPHCGCQNLLKKRYNKVSGMKTLKEMLLFGNVKCNCEESEGKDNE